LTARWIRFANDAPYNAGTGGGATLERQTDFLDAMNSTAAQLITTMGSNRLNELRVQFAQRHQQSSANADSGSGAAITITSPAVAFGGPFANTGQNSAGFDFKQKIWQVIDNFTYVRGSHSYKFGLDWQHVYDERVAARQFVYTFPSIASYLAAKSGANPFGYSTVQQLTGDSSFNMRTNLFAAFVQDDWQIAPRVKLLYGLRYDLYKYPDGLDNAPLAQTRSFNVDTNNLSPRVGLAWALGGDAVLRASSGLMFDQPILGGYEQALQLSGLPKAPV
jgi:outer membrane receptor protein involved in Fe transport